MTEYSCPKCTQELKENEFQRTFTDTYYRCPKCDRTYNIKTVGGLAAQLAPVVIGVGVGYNFMKAVLLNEPDGGISDSYPGQESNGFDHSETNDLGSYTGSEISGGGDFGDLGGMSHHPIDFSQNLGNAFPAPGYSPEPADLGDLDASNSFGPDDLSMI